MRKAAFVALLACITVAGAAPAATDADTTTPGTDAALAVEDARDRLTDLLFSDEVDRIDFQATNYEEGVVLIHTSVDRILNTGIVVLGDATTAADKATEVILALNASKAKGTAMTFQKNKQSLPVRNRDEAVQLADIVAGTISIIHNEYGSGDISYGEKAANLFSRVRTHSEDAGTLMETYLQTVDLVADLSPRERSDYLN